MMKYRFELPFLDYVQREHLCQALLDGLELSVYLGGLLLATNVMIRYYGWIFLGTIVHICLLIITGSIGAYAPFWEFVKCWELPRRRTTSDWLSLCLIGHRPKYLFSDFLLDENVIGSSYRRAWTVSLTRLYSLCGAIDLDSDRLQEYEELISLTCLEEIIHTLFPFQRSGKWGNDVFLVNRFTPQFHFYKILRELSSERGRQVLERTEYGTL